MATKCPKCQTENPDTQRYCGDCGTPLSPSEEGSPSITKTLETPVSRLEIGSLFAGRYKIVEELGKGGMGEVYRARDEKLDEHIALKVLKPEIAAEKQTIERFKNELKFARKIAHRHVCKMYDLSEERETPFITMEYVRGRTLKSLIREKGKLEEREVIGIAKQVCEGLAEAHELGVVHRDLKPQNIMIDEKGNAKIMDFGIARSLEAPGVTKAGVMIGTPDYISPEQAEGFPADHRSDVYSLGIILYEMATGSLPFEGDTAFSVALKHKTHLPQDPRKVNPGISEKLSRLILICMEKDRERRYQTAQELLSDLRNIEEGFPLGTTIRPRKKTFVSSLIQEKLFIPAGVVVLAVIGVFIWQRFLTEREAPAIGDRPSIAILPFDDLSPLKDQAQRCEGLAETLITALSQIENLYVPARTSAFSFKGREKNYREIGEKLHVRAVLEGGIQKAGERLRITARVINTSDGSLVWGDTYNGEEKDIFDIQDQITFGVVDILHIDLAGKEKTRLVKRYTENFEAYNLYQQGRYYWNKRTQVDLRKSIDCFRSALENDPNYAAAHAGVADAYTMLGMYGTEAAEAFSESETAARKALELDEELGDAHASLAAVKLWYEWNWEEAEREFKRAIELNPNYPTARHWYAFLLSALARHDEAILQIKRAQELDPLSPIISAAAGKVYYWARKYDLAIEECKNTFLLYPDYPIGLNVLGDCYIEKSMFTEAIEAFQKSVSGYGDLEVLISGLGRAYAFAGKKDEAYRILEELDAQAKEKYISSYDQAQIYVGLGEKDKALGYLEKAYEERYGWLPYLAVLPYWDTLRDEPRFQALVKKMGL